MLRHAILQRNNQRKGKFVVVSNYGWCWNMTEWLKDEGHEAVLVILEESYKHVADGLTTKAESLDEVLKGDSSREWILVADNIGMGRLLDDYRRQGWKVWGGGLWGDRIEKDRQYAMRFFESSGIQIPPTYTAQGIDDARRFIIANKGRWVLKPHDNKVSVYISENIEDALEILDLWQDMGLSSMEIDIQLFINGRNVDVEYWYANGYPCMPPNYTVETKKFMVDDLGQTVGCMSSVVWCSFLPSRVITEVLNPFARGVRRFGWCGPVSINIMVEDETNQLYALEVTPRIGYNAYWCLHHLKMVGWGELIMRMVEYDPSEGMLAFPMNTHQFAVAIEVSIPPSPFEHPDKKLMQKVYGEVAKGVPIFVHGTYPAHVHLCDVMKDDRGRIVCAGTNAIVAEVVAVDDTAEGALKKCADTIRALRIANKQARIRDAIEDFQKYYPKWVERNIVAPIHYNRYSTTV